MASTHGAEWSGRFVQVSEIEGVLLIAGGDTRTHQPPAGWVLTDPDNPSTCQTRMSRSTPWPQLPTAFISPRN